MGCTLTTEEVTHIDRTIAALKSENDGYAGQLTRLTYEAELLRSENAKLRELCADLYAEMITYSDAPNYNASVWAPKLRELGVEVDE